MPQPGEYLLQYRDKRDGYIPRYMPRKEWKLDDVPDPYDLVDIVHRTIILLLGVMRNVLGEIVYIIRLEDPENLKQPFSFELWVDRGSLNIIQLSSEEEQNVLRKGLPTGYQVCPDAIKEVKHNAKFTLGGVMANNLGEIAYLIYLEDPPNLEKPVGGELYIRDDGKARMEQSEDPTELILGVRSEIE